MVQTQGLAKGPTAMGKHSKASCRMIWYGMAKIKCVRGSLC